MISIRIVNLSRDPPRAYSSLRFKNEEALLAHRASDKLKEVQAASGQFLTGPPQDIIGSEVSAWVR